MESAKRFWVLGAMVLVGCGMEAATSDDLAGEELVVATEGTDATTISGSSTGGISSIGGTSDALELVAPEIPGPQPPSCFADFNDDGVVNAADQALLLGAWGSSNAEMDLNHSGIVNAHDLVLLLANWGSCS